MIIIIYVYYIIICFLLSFCLLLISLLFFVAPWVLLDFKETLSLVSVGMMPCPVSWTGKASDETGSYQKGRFIRPKPKLLVVF